MHRGARRSRAVGVVCALGLVLAACAAPGPRPVAVTPEGAVVPVPPGQRGPAVGAGRAVPPPGPLVGRLRTPDLVVVARRTIPAPVRRRVATAPGVRASLPLGLATAPVGGRTVTLAAVDPSTFRRFMPEVTARADDVWARVAEGDLALTPELSRDLRQELGGELVLGTGSGARLRVGAQAPLVPRIDAVVNDMRGRELGMAPANALLVSTGGADPGAVARTLRSRLGRHGTVSVLATGRPSRGRQTAFLTGGSVAAAVGSFRYRYFEDGRVEPDPAWVAANLRTEEVPILGAVTCHRVMLPQLRGALDEVVDLGLEEAIHPDDFGGCYAPRFIESDPEKGLSLHTWGIAVDLNVQGNLRGTAGEIDPRVVDVFKRWGFAWGGDWAYTDPMHFELAALVRPR